MQKKNNNNQAFNKEINKSKPKGKRRKKKKTETNFIVKLPKQRQRGKL